MPARNPQPKLPTLPRLPSPRTLPGAPRVVRAPRGDDLPPWETIPPSFRRDHPAAPVTEWACYWVLTVVMHYREWRDFEYQQILPIPGIYHLRRPGTSRADFWLLTSGRNGLPDAGFPRGVVINPISFFTHKDIGIDRTERYFMGQAGFKEIFIDEINLIGEGASPEFYVRQAAAGHDLSSRK